MREVRLILLLLSLTACHGNGSYEAVQHEGLLYRHMDAEALPPLHHPRTSHALWEVAGEPVVIGGHTTGFLTTSTAEYLHNGRWRVIPTLYPHDAPFSLPLKEGTVLVGGGYENSFGIGQTWGVEKYSPETHSFSPMPILDHKRAQASALELSDGSLLICGNWFAPDAVEHYFPGDVSSHLQEVGEDRAFPYILPVGPDTFWVFGSNCNSWMKDLRGIVDVVGGEPFTPELFREWVPAAAYERNVPAGFYTIGPWTYLLPARDSSGCMAPMKVSPEGFSLIEMEQPLPMEGPWGHIYYAGTFWVEASARTAWLKGQDALGHVFLAAVEYGPALDGGKASFSMYYSDPLEQIPAQNTELRLSDGRFILAGGASVSNYEPQAQSFMLYPMGRPSALAWWPFALLALVLGGGAAGFLLKRKKTEAVSPVLPPENNADKGLRNRLLALMEERQFYRKKGLKITDVATELGTNTTYVSACLSGQMGTSFRNFVTEYRIAHAKRLMQENPQMRLSEVGEESGFSNEKTFLRTFKAVVGVTPTEWKKRPQA